MRRRPALLPLLSAAFTLALLAVPASAAAPTATGLPSIGGAARAGQVLTSTTGTFTGTAPLAYTRTWQRCDAAGAACMPIAGASGATYTLTAGEVGATMRVAVTATNVEGSASAASPATAVVGPAAPPVNDGALPAISGTPRDGQILNATTGGWSGTAPITFTRMWRRCDPAGASCVPLAGAATHTLTSGDVGATIRIEITARNADGEGVATSAQTAVVDAAPPVNTAPPVMTGTARSGQTLTSSSPGTWSGTTPLTYTRQWSRCDAGGADCDPIAGARGLTYLLTDADVGATIRIAVTATNVTSSATATSVASAAVGPKVPPVKTADPAIAGSAVDGQVLTAGDGSWSGTATITTSRRWQRCAPLGVDCVELAAAGATLALTSADVGFAFRTRVTATNPDGSAEALSALTPVVAPAAPASLTAPAITGSAREGQLLSASQGTWKGTPAIAYAYAWQRCTAGACSAIPGATSATYRVASAELGSTLRVAVTATNAAGTSSVQSPATATVIGGLPVNLDAPELSAALPRDGELYSSTTGTWAGTEPLVLARQWLRCSAAGASCTPLSGEIAATYRVGAADLGKTIRLEVTATNAHGATKAQSAPSPVILAAPPVADGDPAITGELRDGQLLTAASQWSGTAPIALTYQWQRCDALVDTCADIASATASTYRLTSSDVGSRMRVRIGALNAGGGGVASSVPAAAGDAAGLVAPDAPRATAAPQLSGSAVEGSVLTTSGGTFSGTTPLTRSYRWQRCDASGDGCADIAGATSPEIALAAADRGFTLRAVVSAVNGSGSDSIASAPSAVVVMAAPRNLVAPVVTPQTGLRDGATLVGTAGGWTGSEPMTLAHRWQRCKSASDCAPVAGAASPTYMLTAADVGFSLRLVVSASNGAGTTAQASALTGVVGTNPPISVTPPEIIGTARDGGVLTVVDGTWAGPVVVTTTYEWWRCDTLGANCVVAAGATAQSFVPGPADIGLTLRARVVRTSDGGTTAVLSAPSAPVAPAPPQNIAAPQVTGPAAVGRLLTADRGTWSGTPALHYAYAWRRCDTAGSACEDIAGATGPTYRATEADDGARLRVVVSATNVAGAATATSPASPQLQSDPPELLDPPQIVVPPGPLAAGVTLTAQEGTWAGAEPISFEFAWLRCDGAMSACAAIDGAASATYLLAAADVGKRIVVRVTATNVVDATTHSSDPTAAVLPPAPSVAVPPAVSAAGGARAGAKLTATTGTWTGATPMTYAIAWLRCAADGTGCVAVPGAAGASYTLTAGDVGHRMRARVTATNVTAEATSDSPPTAQVSAAPVTAPPPPPPPPPPAASGTTTPKTSTTASPTSTATTSKTAAGTASTTTRTSARKPAGSPSGAARPIAGVQRLRLTPAGRLQVILRCPRASRRACGAVGTIVGGTSLGELIPQTSLRFAVRSATVRNGRTLLRSYRLTTTQRSELAKLRDVNFRVRLARPGATKRFREVFVRTRVPAALRG